jgi:hypothetical protein
MIFYLLGENFNPNFGVVIKEASTYLGIFLTRALKKNSSRP